MKISAVVMMGGVVFGCQNSVKIKTAKKELEKSAVTYRPGAAVDIKDGDDNTPALYLGDAASICSGVSFYNAAGELQTGTANCSASRSDAALKPEDIKQGVIVGGVTGTAVLASDTPEFQPENIRVGVTLGGVAGTLIPSPVACTADGQINCVSNASFPAAAATGLAAKVATGQTVAGVNGSFAGSYSNCTAANQSGCVATASFKTMDLSAAGAATGLSSANFNATIATAGNFEFWDATGARHIVAGDADLIASNVLSGKNIFGVAGSVTASPANCSGNGSQSCVATGSYFAATSCAADGSNCYLPAYAATTQPLKAISYDAINAGKSSIRTSLTLSGIAGTLADCSSNAATGCVTTASYKSADLSNLAAGNIKRGISIAGTTGNFPSAASPLPNYSDSGATTNTAGSDITDLSNFITQLTTDGPFEYWDSTGVRRTGSGDSDITAANIKNAVALENLSITGSYTGAPNCTTDGQTACTTTSTFKAVDTSALRVWDIRKGKTAGGISGRLTFFKNMADTSTFNRIAGTSAAAGLDVYDTIDDYNANWTFPTQNPGGWDKASGVNWTEVVANTSYKDEMTGLVWLKDQGPTLTWESAITQCENSTAGSRSDWRLPTQKELMQAYTDGIWSLSMSLPLYAAYYWSATTVSVSTTGAWKTALFDGSTLTGTKTVAESVVCVAP